jgi:hypothetical protein
VRNPVDPTFLSSVFSRCHRAGCCTGGTILRQMAEQSLEPANKWNNKLSELFFFLIKHRLDGWTGRHYSSHTVGQPGAGSSGVTDLLSSISRRWQQWLDCRRFWYHPLHSRWRCNLGRAVRWNNRLARLCFFHRCQCRLDCRRFRHSS